MTPGTATASGSPMQPPVVQPPVVPPVVLEGRHVRLEPLTLGHARALVSVGSGPRETYGFTLVPADEPSMLRYIEAALRDQETGRALPFATVAKATGRVVGSTRFGNIEFWAWPPDNPHQRGTRHPTAQHRQHRQHRLGRDPANSVRRSSTGRAIFCRLRRRC